MDSGRSAVECDVGVVDVEGRKDLAAVEIEVVMGWRKDQTQLAELAVEAWQMDQTVVVGVVAV